VRAQLVKISGDDLPPRPSAVWKLRRARLPGPPGPGMPARFTTQRTLSALRRGNRAAALVLSRWIDRDSLDEVVRRETRGHSVLERAGGIGVHVGALLSSSATYRLRFGLSKTAYVHSPRTGIVALGAPSYGGA
jgi:hypothetical protein